MSEQQQIRSVITVLAVMALLVSAVIALVVFNSGVDEQGIEPSTEKSGGDFVLQSSSGPVSLKQFRGQVVLLFFGYTHCPDVCPTTMSNVADAIGLLSESEQKSVQPLFITIDPERDTVEHLAEYVAFFHPKLIGLSGSAEQVKKVAIQYGIQFFRDDQSDAGKGNYLMNHTSYLFLIDPHGAIADMMSEHTSPQAIAEAVRQYVSR